MESDLNPEPDRLLEVRALSVEYAPERAQPTEALRGVDLDVSSGEVVGILGESGSGKSTLALALLGLLPPEARIPAGSVRFAGRELLGLSDRQLDRLRGDHISMVFQEPGLALSPFLRVGSQICDVVRAHRRVTPDAARRRAVELLRQVRLDDPEAAFRAYPHQLSGGQRQRVVIAQALACGPQLVVADEPTTAVDTVTQAALLDLLASLRRDLGMALLLVSHDPALLARVADRIVVMYAGRIVEEGPAAALLAGPAHPYPRELLRCVAPTARARGGERRPLAVIPGAPPSLAPAPPGCAFDARCPDRLERCGSECPALTPIDEGRRVACWAVAEAAQR